MAEITPQKISQSGVTPSFVAAAAGGDTFGNDGKTFLYVKNGDVSATTVTIAAQEECNHGFLHDLEVSVDASSEEIIGPFQTDRFNDDTGLINVNYSSATSVTVAVLKY